MKLEYQPKRICFKNMLRMILCLIIIRQSQAISGTNTSVTSQSPLWSNITCLDDLNNTNHKIDYVHGDIIISVITIDPIPSYYVLNRVNDLIDSNLSLGIRTIAVQHPNDIKDVLLDEVQYLEQCVSNPIGILVSNSLWPIIDDIVADIEYNIWKLPASSEILFPNIAHLLYEFPWKNSEIPSVELKAESAEIANSFLASAIDEHLCLSVMPSEENIYLIMGNEVLMDDNFDENGTIFAIPMFSADVFIKDLPHGSYIFLESEIQLRSGDRKLKFGLSNLLIISSILSNLAKFINKTAVLCNITVSTDLSTCKDLKAWMPNTIKLDASMDFLKDMSLNDYADDLNVDLIQKIVLQINGSVSNIDLRQVASINVVSNVTTFYHYKDMNDSSIISNKTKLGQYFPCDVLSTASTTITQTDDMTRKPIFIRNDYSEMYWRIKPEFWVAAGLTVSVLGVLISIVILLFIVFRIYMNDVLEGNPVGTIILLISLVVLFLSFVPFCMEYTSDKYVLENYVVSSDHSNTICSIRIFLLTLCYSLTFSLLLCRALMLASIGSEGGFLSHVNGYVQSVICMFSALVQIGLSTQLVVLMHVANESISCDNIYYGNWLWAILAYDSCLLAFLVLLIPLIFRSQRNYKEGVLLTIGTILCLAVWATWIPFSTFGENWRDAAIPLGLQGTGWAILGGILIPRCFLIVRGIARTDLAQALPSLTSLAFAHNTQYMSEQSIYECVNPAMRQRGISNDNYSDRQSPSEIPTLPLRGASRKNQNPMSYSSSEQSTIPASPSKATRF